MHYLIDANIFIKVICDNIYGVANICHMSGCEIAITKTILDELDPGYYKEQENPNLKDTHRIVNNLVTGNQGIQLIRMIRLDDIKGAKDELKKIRERYYGWLTQPEYLQKMIVDGKLTREEIKKKNFRNKDLGECELIAIAICAPKEYVVVSDDQGRIYKHPDHNIFESILKDHNIRILWGKEWLKEIGLAEEKMIEG